MSSNKQTVLRYMEGFRTGDHAEILACLTKDVEWLVPGAFHVRGREAFEGEIESEGFSGLPAIDVDRLTEEAGVVIAEGTVVARLESGEPLRLAICDVFEMEAGLIRKLTSYLVPT